jgi:MFS family permease
MAAPWRDARFWPLLIFGCWLSFSNGLTQAAQNIYPKDVLVLGLFALAVMRTSMQFGQMGFSAWAGRFSDRYGNRPTLVASQILLAAAPLFFILASPQHPYLVAGAWIAWSAYAGLNICLPNLSLKFGGIDNSAAYVATYFGVTSVCYAASTIAGGYLFDFLGRSTALELVDSLGGKFLVFFWVAFLLRAVAVFWLLAIPEPGAWTWREIWHRSRAGGVSPRTK